MCPKKYTCISVRYLISSGATNTTSQIRNLLRDIDMPFEANASVRLVTAPDRIGRITGKTRLDGDRLRYEVSFGLDVTWTLEGNLEAAPTIRNIYDLLQDQAYGGVEQLRSIMTHAKLTGSLADVIYSMEASNTDFYPHQFKPVLNFLDSPSQGILIADEVGLGKTIEAGLIWTELRARQTANRLLVLCPARLRLKWKQELLHKFGIKSEVCSAEELLRSLQSQDRFHSDGFVIIASLEGLRPPADWDAEHTKSTARLAHFLQQKEAEVDATFDCVVVDEAHYLRNPSTQTNKLVQLIRPTTEHILLLSATPIQLKSDDLFQLLRLIDSESFTHSESFGRILKANKPLVTLASKLRQPAVLTTSEFTNALSKCQVHGLSRDSRQIKYLLENPPNDAELADPEVRVLIANRIERINLLSRAVTRTRKRDVQEDRAIRQPVAPQILMTPAESEFYCRVTDSVRDYCEDQDLVASFILTIPQRQMCSSIPAVVRDWAKKANNAAESTAEDFLDEDGIDTSTTSSSDQKPLQPLLKHLKSIAANSFDFEQFKVQDSKYKVLLDQLTDYWEEYPDKKVILFSFYRKTLQYLKERLEEDHINATVIMGGMKEDTYTQIEQFRTDSSAKILLSSEVGSEGVDLQFSSFLINYDLPWNPMRVEQRIGRIDRIGQQEDRINIINFFYANTLDDRIYNRLYERLDVFRNALGDIEEVLGEKVSELTRSLLSHRLTAAEEEARIEQTQFAIAQTRQDQEKLETEAAHLVAHSDYVLNQVNAAREMGRYIDPPTIWHYVHDFMTREYPGSQFVRTPGDLLQADVELSQQARVDLQGFMEKNRSTGPTQLASHIGGQRTRCVFSNHADLSSGKQEIVTQYHPLVRFVTNKLSNEPQFHPLVSSKIHKGEVPQIPTGHYLLLVGMWSTTGARAVEKLVTRGIALDGNMLSDEDAERLLTAVTVKGRNWQAAPEQTDHTQVKASYDRLENRLDDDFSQHATFMKFENEDRIDQIVQNIELKTSSMIGGIQNTINEQRSRNNLRLIPANEGRIRRLEQHLADRKLYFDNKRKVNTKDKKILAGLINVI